MLYNKTRCLLDYFRLPKENLPLGYSWKFHATLRPVAAANHPALPLSLQFRSLARSFPRVRPQILPAKSSWQPLK